jgi:hypothetical protein
MFDTFTRNNSITKIAKSMPLVLVEKYEKKQFYLPEEVKKVFLEKLDDQENIEYAYAMFCTQADFNNLADELDIKTKFSDLRLGVSKKCFEGWPRFNFDSLLAYSQQVEVMGVAGELGGYGCDFIGGG